MYLFLYTFNMGIRGAMVARLTPDQKVACSINVGFKLPKNIRKSLYIFWIYSHLLYETARRRVEIRRNVTHGC